MTDYGNVDETGLPSSDLSWRNKVVEVTEYPFTILFTLECIIKIIVMGFIKGPNTYLRDSWNRLDFIVVASRYVSSKMRYDNMIFTCPLAS